MRAIRSERGSTNPFVPIFLLATALMGLLLFQTTQLSRERANLHQLAENQQQPLEEAKELRAQLNGVAADLARLAERGNHNAKKVVEELASRGITIKSESQSAREP